jgi:hypothetical protein
LLVAASSRMSLMLLQNDLSASQLPPSAALTSDRSIG